MTTTLTGKNSFELLAAKKAFVSAFIAEHGDMAVEVFDAEAVEPQVVYDALTNLPFLVTKKLVVLNEPSHNRPLSEKLPDWLGESDGIDVLIVELQPDKRTSFYKFLQKNTSLKDFPLLRPQAMTGWISTYAKQAGVKLTPAATRLLIERVGAPRDGVDPKQYAQEIDKLALFKSEIDTPDVAELVEELPQNTVFDMLDALVQGNSKRTVELYQKLTAQRIDPAEILAMLIWQVHTLTLIRAAGGSERDIAQKTKLHPFVIQKNYSLASKLSIGDIRKIVDLLFEAELHIKRDGYKSHEVVSTLITKLLIAINK